MATAWSSTDRFWLCAEDNQCGQTHNPKETVSHEDHSPGRSQSVRPSIPKFAPIDRGSKAEWRRISGCSPWRHIPLPHSLGNRADERTPTLRIQGLAFFVKCLMRSYVHALSSA